MVNVNSSVIMSVDTDILTNSLLITFKGGKTYQYAGASAHFTNLCNADSAGKYFCDNIRGKYEAAQI